MENITYDDFKKVDLRVAKIIEAERVEKSEKLVKLKLDVGNDGDEKEGGNKKERQIVAGIGAVYTPETLVGKQIIIVANLEPRKLMGHESQGMLLAASNDIGPVLLVPESEVEEGVKIK